MKKLVISLASILVASISCHAQEATTENCPGVSLVQVDGITDEWPMKWVADPDKHFSYNICTDDNNLYIRMKTSDDVVKRKIALFGFTLWMDPNGKKKRKLGLRFPTGVEAKDRMDVFPHTNMSQMSSSQRAELQKEISRTLLKDLEILELIGLADDPLTSTRSGITNGLKVAIAVDSVDTYFYEALVPFKSFRISKASVSELGIGLETGKYSPPPSKAPPSGGAGGSGGYGGRGYGAGGYGGYGGGGGQFGSRGPSSPMSATTVTWTTVKLK